jgi:16S rRNA (adenine1518-N6/adenine1519-N6)-dimethyltransferase
MMADLGLAPSRARGQNFLRDPNFCAKIADMVVDLANISPEPGPVLGPERAPAGESGGELGGKAPTGRPLDVLEIGPGLGAITGPLLARGLSLTAVELDRGLAEALGRWPEAEAGRLRVLGRDVLGLDLGRDLGGGEWLVFGNLPYNLSTPILFWFMDQAPYAQRGLFMVQKEMAERLTAQPGSRDYGRLSVAVSLWQEVRTVMAIPSGAFQPRPKVESRLVFLGPKSGAPPSGDRQALGYLTRTAFFSRRKTILNNLSARYGKDRSVAALEEIEVSPESRAETLAPETLYRLALLLEAKRQIGYTG